MVKKILTILTVVCLCSIANAQQTPLAKDTFYTINNFSTMLKSHVSPFLIKKGEAQEAINVRANAIYGSLVKRPKMFELSSCREAAVKSLYRYYLSDDTKHTVQASSTYVDAVADSDGTCTSLYENGSDGKRWSFITYKDKLIGMNGTNNAKKWDGSTSNTANTDGHRTAGDLMGDLGAPLAELNTGANLTASRWYQYKIAYYDGSTYKYSASKSNPIVTGSTVRDIYLTDVPLGEAGTTFRYLFRTLGNTSRANVVADTTYYNIGTISNNSTLVFSDDMNDGVADNDQAPTWTTVSGGTEVTPPKAKYPLINKERVFMANDPSGTVYGKSTIYWSKALRPDYYDFNTDYELIRPDDGDEITFVKNLYGLLTVGKTRTINKLYTELIRQGTSSTFTVTPSDPFSFIGCVSPWSAVNAITGIIYVNRYGLYNFNGQVSELISDSVSDKIRDILETNLDEVVGAFHDNGYIMSYTSSDSGEADNDSVLEFDITRNSYVEDTGAFDSFSVFDSGDDAGLLYAGSSGTDGKVWVQGQSFDRVIYRYKTQLEGGTYESTYVGGEEEDPWIELGSPLAWVDEGTETWAGSGSKTWMIEDLTGNWWSPVIQFNASALDKLFWNESLGASGNVTFSIRTGATAIAVESASWSDEFSDPSGSDISEETANAFIQIRASLSSTVYTEAPRVFLEDSFVIKLTYQKSGVNGETAYLSFWKGGIDSMGSENPKRIKEFQVFYQGTEGTLTVYFANSENVEKSFDIDLSVNPTESSNDSYFGTNQNKIFTYIIPYNVSAIGRQFTFSVAETGTEVWSIDKMNIRYDTNPYSTFRRGL